jgi:hypothetical protein
MTAFVLRHLRLLRVGDTSLPKPDHEAAVITCVSAFRLGHGN